MTTPPVTAVSLRPAVRCLYQRNPRPRERWPVTRFSNRSPTSSLESRRNWARRHACVLRQNHCYALPTHIAVMKFERPVTVTALKEFTKKLGRLARDAAKKQGSKLAAFWVVEVEANNRVHYHLLIRTDLPDPAALLAGWVGRASQGLASLAYCKPVESVEAASKYAVKDLLKVKAGEKKVLLFKRRLGLRTCGQFGGYFVKTKAQLCRESRRPAPAPRREVGGRPRWRADSPGVGSGSDPVARGSVARLWAPRPDIAGKSSNAGARRRPAAPRSDRSPRSASHRAPGGADRVANYPPAGDGRPYAIDPAHPRSPPLDDSALCLDDSALSERTRATQVSHRRAPSRRAICSGSG
jgi:hypothetical protein